MSRDSNSGRCEYELGVLAVEVLGEEWPAVDASAYVDGLVVAVDVRTVSNSVLNIAVGLFVSYLYNVAVCLFISCIFLTITMYSQRMHIKRLKWSYPV